MKFIQNLKNFEWRLWKEVNEMAVTTVKYGNFTTHVGALAEVMAAIKGQPHSMVLTVYYDAGTSKTTAVVKTPAW